MAELSTQPVMTCRWCGRPFKVAALRTIGADPEGTRLMNLLRGIANDPLCPACRNRQAYYAQAGRLADFEASRP